MKENRVVRYPTAASQARATGKTIKQVREELNCSRAVFASMLHTNARTLEKWEQAKRASGYPGAAGAQISGHHQEAANGGRGRVKREDRTRKKEQLHFFELVIPSIHSILLRNRCLSKFPV